MKILLHSAITTPNVCGLEPAARFVLEIGEGDPGVSPQDWARATALLCHASIHAQPLPQPVEPSSVAHLFGHACMEILRAHRHPVNGLKVSLLADRVHEISLFLPSESIAAAVSQCALALTGEALGLHAPDSFHLVYVRLRKALAFTQSHFLAIERWRAGALLGLPLRRESRMIFMLGQGVATELASPGRTTATSHLAHEVAGNKSWAMQRLSAQGLPVPLQIEAKNAGAAVAAARRIGYPVVLKPRDGSRGRGVAVNLQSDDAVRSAYADAAHYQAHMVMERFIPGDDHRLLVVGGRFVAAVKRVPAAVIADGVHTISQLAQILGESQRRDGVFLCPIKFDAEVLRTLAGQRFDPDSVPPAATPVRLRGPANVSLGGTTVDVTDQVHPDNRAAAVLAAGACLLDVAGVDFVTTDIARSWRDGVGAIVEVNSGPGVDLHMAPTEGSPRDVCMAVLRSRLPAHATGRLPMVLVSGRRNKRATLRWLEACWPLLGVRAGICLTNAADFQGRRLLEGSSPAPLAALTGHPMVNALALEISPRDLAANGAPLDRVAVTILTDGDVGSDTYRELGDPHVDRRLHRLAADVACGGVVIDGASKTLRRAVSHVRADYLIMVWAAPLGGGANENLHALERHLDAGGRTLTVDQEGGVVFRHGHDQPCRLALLADLAPAIESQTHGNERKALLLALAALLLSGYSPARVVSAMGVARATDRSGSTLVVMPADNAPTRAFADPRDGEAITRIKLLIDQTPDARVALVLSADAATLQALPDLEQRLSGPGLAWCWSGPSSSPLQRWRDGREFPTLGSAWQSACGNARNGDLVVLLAADDTLRAAFETVAVKMPAPAMRDLLDAQTLAQIFAGSWVNGAGRGIVAQRLVLAGDGPVQDACVVIPGRPDDLARQSDIEQTILSAFAAGALAVVAPLVARELPRWQPVLVCDDPALGWERFAQQTRERVAGMPRAC